MTIWEIILYEYSLNYTLIWLFKYTNNVEKIAKFYLKVSNIPSNELNDLLKIIEHNERYRKELDEVMTEEQHRLDKKNEKTLDKDIKNDTKEYGIIMTYNKRIAKIKSNFMKVELKSKYIPNKRFDFLFVGRLTSKANIQLLIKALVLSGVVNFLKDLLFLTVAANFLKKKFLIIFSLLLATHPYLNLYYLKFTPDIINCFMVSLYFYLIIFTSLLTR